MLISVLAINRFFRGNYLCPFRCESSVVYTRFYVVLAMKAGLSARFSVVSRTDGVNAVFVGVREHMCVADVKECVR